MIELRGVRVHNLKNVNVDIPRCQLVAVCGVSGSGKTSLAIDTLYAEGQRRYIESFSAYTRQFLERLDKPEYDRIDGLPPALAVTRGSQPRGNRSTVGTASECLDYLRLLFAKVARSVCYQCGQPVTRSNPQLAAQLISQLPRDGRLMIAFEAAWEDVTQRAEVLSYLQASGFVRLLADTHLLNLGQDERGELAHRLPVKGQVWVIVDRVKGGDPVERTTESLEIAFAEGGGQIALLLDQQQPELIAAAVAASGSSIAPVTAAATADPLMASTNPWWPLPLALQLRCLPCGIDYPDPEPRLFSFNSPLGACPACEGFGDSMELDLNLIVPDPNKTLREGALAPWCTPAHSHHWDELLELAPELGLPVDVPFRKLGKRQVTLLLEGKPSQGFAGLKRFFAALERKKYKMHVRVFLSRWRSYSTCTACGGARLSPLALAYRVGDKNFAELCELEIAALEKFLAELALDQRESHITAGPREQVQLRLGYLQSVGLGYLTLNRTLRTLSGGEAQRTALTAALGSSLVNMLYVLDEPSVGLHPHDVRQLAVAIERLAGRGNTVVMIEHEEELLRRAQWLIEIGPQAGAAGGQVVFSGTHSELEKSPALTGDYLTGKRLIPIPAQRRQPTSGSIHLRGCRGHNLQGLSVEFPLGLLCLVTGVSGSGKSSLVQDTLYGAVANRQAHQSLSTLPYDSIEGCGLVDDCILVDQSPISRSPRSNAITYIKAFDEIRQVFAATPDAKLRNFSPSHFSFNSELGRCANCQGDGVLEIDMQFLADVTMTCPDCHGDRYRSEVLQVRYRDRNIADVLHMTVREAIHFFRGSAKVQQKLKVLTDVGLDYLQLGQAATTLSSGEAQRLKLAGFLSSATRRKTLFLLDEPTTGLHTHDLLQLLDCFDALIAAGHSLVVVEHNLHLMAAADYIIDLGPGAAAAGGQLVACGTPETVAAQPHSLTGRYLREFFEQREATERDR